MTNKRHTHAYRYEPLISVIVPIYNSAKYLKKSIQSIIDQTYKNIEIILVNDGSTDNSLEIIKSFKTIDNRIVIVNQENSGGIIARKNGIKKAKGEYIIIEDSDDWLEHNLIEECIKVLNNNSEIDIIKFGYISEPSGKTINIIDNKKIHTRTNGLVNKNELLKLLIYSEECNAIWNEMVKKELYDFNDDIFNKIVHKGEDLQINLQIFQKATHIVLLRHNLYHYYKNPNGITQNNKAEKIVSNIKDNIYLNKTREKIAKQIFREVNEEAIKSKTLKLLSNKIINVLAFSNNTKRDLIIIHRETRKELNEYIGKNSPHSNKGLNYLQKQICKNIIADKPMKNMKYAPICKLIMKVKAK